MTNQMGRRLTRIIIAEQSTEVEVVGQTTFVRGGIRPKGYLLMTPEEVEKLMNKKAELRYQNK